MPRSLDDILSSVAVENRVILLTARGSLDPSRRDRLTAILSRPIDWHRLYELSVTHGTTPLLFRHLNALRSAVPGKELRALGRSFIDNATRCRQRVSELLDLLEGWEAEGISATPYKGPALAAFLYGDESLRPAGDLDVLLRQADVPGAMNVLRARGYRPGKNGIFRARFDPRHTYHTEFSHETKERVELHWRLTDDLYFPVDWDEWWRRRVTLNLAGRAVKTLAPEETLLALSQHGAKELWNRLLLVADVGELISRASLDWRRVLDLSVPADVRRVLLVALLTAQRLLELPLPGEIQSLVDARREIHPLVRRIVRRLATCRTRIIRPPERIPFALAIRSPRERTLYLANYLRVLVTPDKQDLAYVKLPRSLWLLYYLVRPVRRTREYLFRLGSWLFRRASAQPPSRG